MHKVNCLKLLLLIFIISPQIFADEFNGIIEVEENVLPGTSYRDRRTPHGFIFGINYRSYYPVNYNSAFDNVAIQDFFGSHPLQIPEVSLGYKYNFSLGSLGVTFHYASGSDESEYNGNSRYLAVDIYEGNLNLYLDNLMNEPYVVPYAGVGLQQLQVKEQSADLDMKSNSSGLSLTYRFGLMFQLNWLDKKTAEEGYREIGLENTYLDVYLVSNSSGGDVAEDTTDINGSQRPDVSSDMQLGVGLKIEF